MTFREQLEKIEPCIGIPDGCAVILGSNNTWSVVAGKRAYSGTARFGFNTNGVLCITEFALDAAVKDTDHD